MFGQTGTAIARKISSPSRLLSGAAIAANYLMAGKRNTCPPDAMAGKMRSGQPIEGLPSDGLPPGGLPDLPSGEPPMPGADGGKIRMKTMPRMNARPYLKRAFKLLGSHKAMVALSLLLSLIMFLLPFLAAAAFGPLIKLFGDVAKGGDWNRVWTRTGSFYDRSAQTGNGGGFSIPFISNWLATPLSFT